MRDIIVKGPYKQLSGIGRPDIYVKLECEQFGGSFKARGIVNFLKHNPSTKGLVTFTTGNQGITVAALAQEFGIKAIIVSSKKITAYKRSRIESFNGDVRIVDFFSLDDSINYAKQLAKELDYMFVPVFDNDYLLEGYGGIAEEICNDFKGQNVTAFFPVGTGSILFANARRIKQLDPTVKVIAVEPTVFQKLGTESQEGKSSPSMADCLSVDRIALSNRSVKSYIDGVSVQTEEEIANTTRLLFEQFGMIIEPGATLTLAAALKTPKDDSIKIAVITGKNVSKEDFDDIVNNKATKQTSQAVS